MLTKPSRLPWGSSGDHEKDVKLWDKTLQEVAAGWLIGPYQWEELPADHVVSHRFPLEQSGKMRPIDDYSRSGVNEASRPNPVLLRVRWAGGVAVAVDLHGFQQPSVPLPSAIFDAFHGFSFHAFHDFIIWHAS